LMRTRRPLLSPIASVDRSGAYWVRLRQAGGELPDSRHGCRLSRAQRSGPGYQPGRSSGDPSASRGAGLVLQPNNAKGPLFICTCCAVAAACFGVLRITLNQPTWWLALFGQASIPTHARGAAFVRNVVRWRPFT